MIPIRFNDLLEKPIFHAQYDRKFCAPVLFKRAKVRIIDLGKGLDFDVLWRHAALL
jgi:hypothetical protein